MTLVRSCAAADGEPGVAAGPARWDRSLLVAGAHAPGACAGVVSVSVIGGLAVVTLILLVMLPRLANTATVLEHVDIWRNLAL
ncbi:MAG: hypothetical protein R2851_11720 [Caldilineaceae bacterium]